MAHEKSEFFLFFPEIAYGKPRNVVGFVFFKNSSSSIGKHFRDKHSLAPKDLTKNFSILMKSTNKFDCLVYEMFFIRELRPTLNVQSDSIRAKVFN